MNTAGWWANTTTPTRNSRCTRITGKGVSGALRAVCGRMAASSRLNM